MATSGSRVLPSDPSFLPVWATGSLARQKAAQEGFEYEIPSEDYYTLTAKLERMRDNRRFDEERLSDVAGLSVASGRSWWCDPKGSASRSSSDIRELRRDGNQARKHMSMPEPEEDEISISHVQKGQVPRVLEEDEESVPMQRVSEDLHSWVGSESGEEINSQTSLYAPGHEPKDATWLKTLFSGNIEEEKPLIPSYGMPVHDNQMMFVSKDDGVHPGPSVHHKSFHEGYTDSGLEAKNGEMDQNLIEVLNEDNSHVGQIEFMNHNQLVQAFEVLQLKIEQICSDHDIVLGAGRELSKDQRDIILRQISLDEYELWQELHKSLRRDLSENVDSKALSDTLRQKRDPATFERVVGSIMDPNPSGSGYMPEDRPTPVKRMVYAMQKANLEERLELMRHIDLAYRDIHDSVAMAKALQDRVVGEDKNGKVWRSDLRKMTPSDRDWFLEKRRRQRLEAQKRGALPGMGASEGEADPDDIVEFTRAPTALNKEHAEQVMMSRATSHSWSERLLSTSSLNRADNSAYMSAASHNSEKSEHIVSVLHGVSVQPSKAALSRTMSSAASVVSATSNSSRSTTRSKLGKGSDSLHVDLQAVHKVALESTRIKTTTRAYKDFQNRSMGIHFARDQGKMALDPLTEAQHRARQSKLVERSRYKEMTPDPRTGDSNRYGSAGDRRVEPMVNTQGGFWHLNQFNNMAVVTKGQK